MQKIIFTLFLTLVFASCTSMRVVKIAEQSVELGAGLSFELLEPASYGQSLSLTQIAEIKVDKQLHELIFVLQIQANEMTVIGLLPSGTRVFSLVYDGQQVRTEGYNDLIEKLDPKFLIADIQISIWPLDTLREQWLSQQACHLERMCRIFEEQLATDDSKVRTIEVAGKELLTVKFSSNAVEPKTTVLNHVLRGYQISLESTN